MATTNSAIDKNNYLYLITPSHGEWYPTDKSGNPYGGMLDEIVVTPQRRQLPKFNHYIPVMQNDATRISTTPKMSTRVMPKEDYLRILSLQAVANQGVIRDADRQKARQSGAIIYDPKESKKAIAIQARLDNSGKLKLHEDAEKGFSAVLSMSLPSTYYNLFHLDSPLSSDKAAAMDFGTAFLTGAGAIGAKTVSKYAPGIMKRAIEGAMRQSADEIPSLSRYTRLLLKDKDARNYILKGIIKDRDPKQIFGQYQGLINKYVDDIPYNRDYISAVLYGTPLDERIAKQVAVGHDFGPALEEYINKAYYTKKGKIPVYLLETPHYGTIKVQDELVKNINKQNKTSYIFGENTPRGFDANYEGLLIDVGGYSNNEGFLNNLRVVLGTDIWKFNPDDYSRKWIKHPIKKAFYYMPLKIVDHYTTPIVTKTSWGYAPILTKQGVDYAKYFK